MQSGMLSKSRLNIYLYNMQYFLQLYSEQIL